MRYSGTHTIIGELVGRVIEVAVTEGLVRYARRQARPKPRSRAKNP
jgi:adenosylcobinamide amidohydrolase